LTAASNQIMGKDKKKIAVFRLTSRTKLFWANLMFIFIVGGIGLQALSSELVYVSLIRCTNSQRSQAQDQFLFKLKILNILWTRNRRKT
jgi:hypothetical protein